MSAIQESEKIGWLEPFDCDVEHALNQITPDDRIRGQIRFMLIKLTNSNVRVEMAMREKLKLLEETLRNVRANVAEQDCRGDEDCDHCFVIHHTIDPALNRIAQ